MKSITCILAMLVGMSSVFALDLEPCYIGKNGVSQKAECGILNVPIDPNIPDKTLELHVARIAALSDQKKEDPLLLLAGGPGQGAIETFAGIARVYQSNLRDRDLILVDQRGTGSSHPLRCEVEDESLLEEVMDLKSDGWKDWLRDCRNGIDVDVHYFTTTDAIRDLEAVRNALGIKRWNVYGGSYGTRKALTYMKLFPEALRSVILDSVVPQSEPLASSHEANLQNTLKAIFERCKQDTACHETFGDVEQQMWQLLNKLEVEPVQMRVSNPMTGEVDNITFTKEYAAMALRMFSYSSETMGLIPLMISLTNHGQLETMAYQSMMIGASLEEGLNNALELSIVCAEDVPFMGQQPIMANYLFGDQFYELIKARCDIWGTQTVDMDFKSEVKSEIPTLLLSGELDPVTPPVFAQQAMEGLTQSQHLIVPNQGHIVATRGCMPKIIGAFIKDPKAALETECIQNFQELTFFINLNGPQE